MTYKVEWCEVIKTGSGAKGPWKLTKMSLTDPEGNKLEDIQTFMEVIPGQEIEGSVIKNQTYGSLEFKPLARPNFMKKPDISKSVAEAQKRTQEGVQKAQSHTDNAVRISATMRDAVLLSLAEFNADGTQR